MSEPEIARRCHNCGASIRDRAFFCPQCGILLPTSEHAETQPLDPYLAEAVIPKTAAVTKEPAAGDTMPLNPLPSPSQQRPGGIAPSYGSRKASPKPSQPRDGRMVQRVEKLRKMSTVVIDQAAYDPSLRFILVAGFLFLVFLLIVLMSKMIG